MHRGGGLFTHSKVARGWQESRVARGWEESRVARVTEGLHFFVHFALFALFFTFFPKIFSHQEAKFPEGARGLAKMKFPKGVVARVCKPTGHKMGRVLHLGSRMTLQT